MRRFDYSFLASLALPEDTTALEKDLEGLASRLERRQTAAQTLAEPAAILEQFEAEGLPGFAQALAQAGKKDFLHILAIALGDAGLEQEKSLALGQALSAYDSARRSLGDSLGLVACVVLDCICIAPVPRAPLGCGLLLAQSLLCQMKPTIWVHVPLAATFQRYRCLFQPAFQKAVCQQLEDEPDYGAFIPIFLALLYLSLHALDREHLPAPAVKRRGAKRALIEDFVRNSPVPVRKADICAALPQVSPTTVEAVLGAMVKSGAVKKLGAARNARYIRG